MRVLQAARGSRHAASRGGCFAALGTLLALQVLLHAGCALLGPGEAAETPRVFYPAPPEQPRIQFLASFTSGRDVEARPSRFRRFVLGEPEYGELGKPYGVALHEGKIFVCDTRARAVIVFDLVGHAVQLIGDTEPGRLRKPINVAVDEDGRRYVADTELGRVMVYGPSNEYVGALGSPDRWSPSDVRIDGRRLYVVDVKNAQVVVVDKRDGRELERFGRPGSGEGEMVLPTNIELDSDGNRYVADTGNARVLKFDRNGRQVQQYGSLGRRLGNFVRPKGIALDREGRLYVVDAAFENVQIFGPDGALLLYFGGAGNNPGGMNLPAAVAINYDSVDLFADRVAPEYGLEYLILVTNQFGLNKVNVYGFLRPRDAASFEREE